MLTATAPQHLDQVFPMLCEPKRRYSLNYSSFTTAQCASFKFILSLGSGIRKRTFKNTGWSAHSAAEKKHYPGTNSFRGAGKLQGMLSRIPSQDTIQHHSEVGRMCQNIYFFVNVMQCTN